MVTAVLAAVVVVVVPNGRKEPADSTIGSEALVVDVNAKAVHHLPCVVSARALDARDEHVAKGALRRPLRHQGPYPGRIKCAHDRVSTGSSSTCCIALTFKLLMSYLPWLATAVRGAAPGVRRPAAESWGTLGAA